MRALWAVALAPCIVALTFAVSGVSALLGERPLVWRARPMTLSDQPSINRMKGTDVTTEPTKPDTNEAKAP